MSARRDAPPFQFDSASQQRLAGQLGIWVFLGTELMFFGPLFLAYAYLRMLDSAGLAMAARQTDLLLGTLNTVVLMTSSFAMAMAVSEARTVRGPRTSLWLWTVAALGAAFLAVKGCEYAKDIASGFLRANTGAPGGDTGQLFRLLYFAMTGLHALHLCIGIALVVVFAVSFQRRGGHLADAARVEVLGLYWHFVDIIWLFLFPILYLPGRSGS